MGPVQPGAPGRRPAHRAAPAYPLRPPPRREGHLDRERLELAEAAAQDRRQGGSARPPRPDARRPAPAPPQPGAGGAPVGLPVPGGQRRRAHPRHPPPPPPLLPPLPPPPN